MKKIVYLLMSVAFMLNMTRCKEDKEMISFDSLFKNVSIDSEIIPQANCLQNGTTVIIPKIDLLEFTMAQKVIFTDTEKKVFFHDVYFGTSEDNMELQGNSIVELPKPFEKYFYKIICGIEYNGERYYSDEYQTEGCFYYVPNNSEIILTSDNGEDEIATKLNWRCVYYGYDNRGMIDKSQVFEVPLDGFTGSLSITTDYDTTYNEKPLEVSLASDEIFVKAGNDYPSSKIIYYPGTETIHYLDAIVYKFTLKIEKNIDGKMVFIENSCSDIFMNKSNCVKDREFNIYRYAKIGNQYWTIDDFRLRKDSNGRDFGYYNVNGVDVWQYPMEIYRDYDEFNGIIPDGFHVPSDEDWNELEACYGVEAQLISEYFNIDGEYDSDGYYHFSEDLERITDPDQDMSSLFSGNDTGIAYYLGSSWGWNNFGGKKITRAGQLGLFPGGVASWWSSNNTADRVGDGNLAVYATSSEKETINHVVRILASGYNGILRAAIQYNANSSIRLVKDKE